MGPDPTPTAIYQCCRVGGSGADCNGDTKFVSHRPVGYGGALLRCLRYTQTKEPGPMNIKKADRVVVFVGPDEHRGIGKSALLPRLKALGRSDGRTN